MPEGQYFSDNRDNLLQKIVEDISYNHRKIIDDWCKAYMAQIYQEGKGIDVGSFTLVQQNLSMAPGEVGHKYWFEYGKPSFEKDRWISVSERIPKDRQPFLGTDGEDCFVAYYIKDQESYAVGGWECCYTCGGFNRVSFEKSNSTTKKVTHWMEIPEAPKE